MKLIKTKLLLKHNHYSPVGFATASHIDFCKYQFKCLRPECSYNEYMHMLVMFISLPFALLFIPFFVLTHGLILYPYWIVLHIVKTKGIAKKYGVDYLNKSAEELVKKLSEKEE